MDDTRAARTLTVCDSIARTLRAYGVEYAFGIPGNDVLETIRACEDAGIRFVLVKSEPTACFMGDAIFQLTGRPTALIPALGPGIANAISGIANSLQERSAMIVLCGEMGTANQAIYNHQVFDHVALCRPVTKLAEALNANRPAQQVAKALDLALAYPAGPVMLNVAADHGRSAAREEESYQPGRTARAQLGAADAQRLCEIIARAQRPLLFVGRGALNGAAPQAVQRFVRAWGMPFFASYKAKGVVSEHDPLCLGAVGLSPIIDAENMKLVCEADLIVQIGFDPIELRDAWLDAWPESRAAITIDWAALNHRIFPAGEQALGDVPAILAQLAPAGTADKRAGWGGRITSLQDAVAQIVRPRDPAGRISPAALFKAVSDQASDDWTMVVDVGAHRILANHVIRCRTPGQLVQSNGFCTMGFAAGAAIGAALVRSGKPVVAIAGDGGMLMMQGELALAAELDLPIVFVVLNDASLSLIKLKQQKLQMAPRATDFRAPRFDAIAQGFGARGLRVESLRDFDQALRDAIAARKLTLIEAMVDPSEYWEQM